MTNKLNNLLRILKKIIKREDVLVVKQDKSKWEAQHRIGRWDKYDQQGGWQPHFYKIIEIISNEKESKILDVGCARGLFYQALKENVLSFNYTGIDISDEAIKEFKNKYPQLNLYASNADKPPNFERKFDLIVFIESILYFDFVKALPKYNDYLEPQGKVIISLYDSWRSWFIWRKINKIMLTQESYKIKEKNGKLSWTVKVVKFR